jgi:hypothetical protein
LSIGAILQYCILDIGYPRTSHCRDEYPQCNEESLAEYDLVTRYARRQPATVVFCIYWLMAPPLVVCLKCFTLSRGIFTIWSFTIRFQLTNDMAAICKDNSSEVDVKTYDVAQQLEQIETGERLILSPAEDRRVLRKIDL